MSTTGLLVLSATDNAMILQNVTCPYLNIINPASGLMVYDTVKNSWQFSTGLPGLSGNLNIHRYAKFCWEK